MQIIQVVGEHPKYSFSKDEIMVVLANNQDRFWIAQVTDMDDKEISLRYFYFTRNGNDDKIYMLQLHRKLWHFGYFI
jgi:hypothetical protein